MKARQRSDESERAQREGLFGQGLTAPGGHQRSATSTPRCYQRGRQEQTNGRPSVHVSRDKGAQRGEPPPPRTPGRPPLLKQSRPREEPTPDGTAALRTRGQNGCGPTLAPAGIQKIMKEKRAESHDASSPDLFDSTLTKN